MITTTTTNNSTQLLLPSRTAAELPCCLCGTKIIANAANQCSTCLAQQINLQERLQQGPGGAEYTTIYQCRQCRRFQQSEHSFVDVPGMESTELLAICLKKIPALNGHHHASSASAGSATSSTATAVTSNSSHARLQLIDAGWIWTEPHSMRLKLHVTVRTEVLNVPVQQRVMIELHIQFRMCPDCNREYTNRTWQAVLQIRQDRTSHQTKTGLLRLEQAIAQNKAIRKHVLRIDQPTKNGFDFYFLQLNQAMAFGQFLQRLAPMRIKYSSKLISTDVKNHTTNTKHTVTCELVPLCRHDLLVLHKSAKKACGPLAGRLALVTDISSVIHCVDASPKRINVSSNGSNNKESSASNSNNTLLVQIFPEGYYRSEKQFTILHTAKRLVRFVVLDVELLSSISGSNKTGQPSEHSPQYKGPNSGVDKYALAEVQVARESDFGVNDETFTCVTHLGHFLSAGDVVLGYDLTSTTLSGGGEWELQESLQNSYVIPDVVLVKKVKVKDDSAAKTTTPTTVEKGAVHGAENKNDDTEDADEDDADALNDGGKRTVSKKKDRRQRRLQGRRRKELEERAMRMGFLQDQEDEEQFMGDLGEDDDDNTEGYDSQLQAELAMLERDLDKLDAHGDGHGPAKDSQSSSSK